MQDSVDGEYCLSFLFFLLTCTVILHPFTDQSWMTNPFFFLNAFVTSSSKSKNALHAVNFDTQVYYLCLNQCFVFVYQVSQQNVDEIQIFGFQNILKKERPSWNSNSPNCNDGQSEEKVGSHLLPMRNWSRASCHSGHILLQNLGQGQNGQQQPVPDETVGKPVGILLKEWNISKVRLTAYKLTAYKLQCLNLQLSVLSIADCVHKFWVIFTEIIFARHWLPYHLVSLSLFWSFVFIKQAKIFSSKNWFIHSSQSRG